MSNIKPHLADYLSNNDKKLNEFMTEAKTLAKLEERGLLDPTGIKNLRGTTFGREVKELTIDGETVMSYFLVSSDYLHRLKEEMQKEQP